MDARQHDNIDDIRIGMAKLPAYYVRRDRSFYNFIVQSCLSCKFQFTNFSRDRAFIVLRLFKK